MCVIIFRYDIMLRNNQHLHVLALIDGKPFNALSESEEIYSLLKGTWNNFFVILLIIRSIYQSFRRYYVHPWENIRF